MELETQTQSQAQDSKKDRSVTVVVTPTLVWHSTNPPNVTATIEYSVSSSDPTGTAVVDPNTGWINISHMPPNSGYTDNIDMTLQLDTSKMKDASGNLLTGDATPRWAKSGEGQTYTDSNGKTQHLGYGWFCNITSLGPPLKYDISPPISIDKMSFKRPHDLKLEIDDKTPDDSPAYAFMMAFVLPATDKYWISIDPLISGKNVGSNSFMLQR